MKVIGTSMNQLIREKIWMFARNHPLFILVLTSLVVTLIHLLTISEYPASWFDEIEILESGRFSFFDIHPKWSVLLIPNSKGGLDTLCPFFHYLSGALLECLYRMTGGFTAGRAIMLLSLPFCAFSIFAWLRGKNFGPIVALSASILFLIDPNATICAHWYRPDLWCITMVLLCCLLITRSRASSYQAILLFTAGVLGATAVFFWITSVLLTPLILVEFCLTYRPFRQYNESWCHFKAFLFLACGWILATAIVLIPLYSHIPDIVAQYQNVSEIGTMMSSQANPIAAAMLRLRDFVKIACRTPFVWITAIMGLIISKRKLIHLILFIATTIFMLSTRVYHLRMVYLMPYLFLFVALAFERLSHSHKKTIATLSHLFLIGALCFGATIAVGAMNYAAWPESNTISLFTQRLKDAVKKHNPRVCLLDFEHECYYAGRALGWQMFSTLDRTKILEEPYSKFLKDIDAIVVSSALPDGLIQAELVLPSLGFAKTSYIEMPPAATGRLKSFLSNIFYAHGYPSCEVWTRATAR